MCAILGDGAITESVVHKWFANFRIGNIDLGDQEYFSRPDAA